MPKQKIAKKKSTKISESIKYSNMFSAYAAFWRRGFTEWAGTSSRSEYWWTCLINTLIIVGGTAAFVIMSMIETTWFGEAGWWSMTVAGLVIAFIIATIIPRISQTTRRLHDVGLSAWWWLLTVLTLFPFFAIIPGVFFFVMSVLPTAVADNPYHKFNK